MPTRKNTAVILHRCRFLKTGVGFFAIAWKSAIGEGLLMASASASSLLAEHPNLYLIGFMGTGKSSVGREVAKRLKMRFLDSDREIEQQTGKSISELFAESGEAYFRDLERRFVQSGHPGSGCVVACGGGLPIPPGMPALLASRGIVVCLFANAETILQRTMHNDRRPLLQVADPAARIRALLAEREPIYMNTGIGVYADGRQLNTVVGNVMRVYLREAKRWMTRKS